MTKIKICGLRRKEDIDIVNKYKPDYVGFVFAKSKRHITITEAKGMSLGINKSIKKVGVFRNQPLNYVSRCIPYIDVIQLHGDEDTLYVEKLKKMTKKPIIKAYRKDKNAKYILLDSINPGNGEKIDWNQKGLNK